MSDKIQVEKVNEVFNKIYCEPGIGYEIKDYFTFKVPNYQFIPAYRNKLWDGNIYLYNPLTCLLYGGLNDHLKQFCEKRNYELEFLSNFNSNSFSIKEAKNFIKSLNLTIEPRDYQIESFTHCIRDNRRLVLQVTGSGKSLVIYLLVRYYNLKTLIITPTTSLVHQMYSDFMSYGYDSENNVHKIYEGQDKVTKKMVSCSTWQSLYKLQKKWFDQFDVVIVDEAHLAKSKSLTTIMTNLDKCKYRFGFTGTLDSSYTHKLMLEALFGSVYQSASTAELIEKKYLSNFLIKSIVLNYPDDVKKSVVKKTYQEEMDFLVSLQARNKFIKNLSLSLKGNTLLLFQYVEKHGKVLFDMLQNNKENKKVYFVHGKVDGLEREAIRKLVEESNDCIIVASYATFSTGTNIKNLHNIIFASPSKSKIRNLQSIGRGLRLSNNKSIATLYDLADDLSWKTRKNFTLLHYIERMKIYNQEKFDYKVYSVNIKI
jgi:superfamily II DNA or RNA helicase